MRLREPCAKKYVLYRASSEDYFPADCSTIVALRSPFCSKSQWRIATARNLVEITLHLVESRSSCKIIGSVFDDNTTLFGGISDVSSAIVSIVIDGLAINEMK